MDTGAYATHTVLTAVCVINEILDGQSRLAVQKAIAEILPQIRGDSQLESGCMNGQRGDQCFRSRFSFSSR
jgi:hypothetical protein